MKFFTAANVAEVKLPELAREAKRRPVLVEICDKFEPQGAPEIRESDVSAQRLQFHSRVEGKRRAFRHEAGKRITIEMVAVRWVGRPIRIRIVWGNNLDVAACFGNAMQLRDKVHHIGKMFDHVTTNDLVELAIREGIWNNAQIVNYIRLSPRIGIDTDSTRVLVLTAADVENPFGSG